ncbi:BlaI/MecI/CopY family transcriptional regulator [Dysosmobacter segnis]|uniref:BlaI/MecI/CopY family transcriptional regulator n=1 Tax=Dysosmobacter segnis TaxID=2763042 RepID=A0A923MIV8_9FIRM|nr:BlaI/MecI/CopY family transcriptional regulator [Dysosmobacter segnis]MBC5771480.1 BlaI/MecI/CopY family transcriptional regulator [Dysosmobacter segnis]
MKIDLSNSEWKLMNHLWQTAPMTITELTAALKEDTSWSKNTVITMLSRLEGKEAVRHEEGRRAKLYFPAVDREDAIEVETETFLDKIGGLGLLMSAMVEKNALTENDIAELSAILEKAGGKL